MPHLMLTDEFWSKLENILLQEAIYNKRNLRMTVEGAQETLFLIIRPVVIPY